jgi:hypothetical protein
MNYCIVKGYKPCKQTAVPIALDRVNAMIKLFQQYIREVSR